MTNVSQSVNPPEMAATQGVGDAVGVPANKWFVAIVGNNTERSCSEKLTRLGYDNYVPTQTETRLWRNGRKKDVARIVFPAMVFVHTTETGRREVVNLPFVKRFLTNRAGTVNEYNRHPVAVIPDEQMEKLRFMLENADDTVQIETARVRIGDRVRVVKGSLRGFEGHIAHHPAPDEAHPTPHTYLVVLIDQLGCAKLSIPLEWVEKIEE